jgi:hypothetical protein
MTRYLWTASASAVFLIAASTCTYMAGTRYLPGILLWIASVTLLGVSMFVEDILLEKVDSPHVDDSHPRFLMLLRFARAIVMLVLGVMIFMLAFQVV